ncbi:MAG: BTAD domain-containing putative transcriptional regulator [Smithella sp.]
MNKISRPLAKNIYLRQRLFTKLDQLRQFPVIWISAPAGSGKTTLVSSYIEYHRIPCLWYQIDRRDEDFAGFFYYMGLAAKKAAPRKIRPLPLLTPEYLQGIPIFTMRFFEKLFGRLKPSSILVLDNYQDISADSPFHEMICNAFSQIPPMITVIVISRNEPPDAIIRLTANRQLDMLTWDDIRLTKEETAAIIASGCHLDLNAPEIVSHLYRLSNGWAAGLTLLSIAARKINMSPLLLGKHSSEEIFAYFYTEIFDRLEYSRQSFFVATAFFPRMTVKMASELTGDSAAGDILGEMNRNNYFIMKHLDSEVTYEYHPLFRDFLLAQAVKTLKPETLAILRKRAAVILEQADQTEAAVALFKDVPDWPAMTELIVRHAPAMIQQGRYHTLEEWLKAVPESVVESNPWLLYWKGAVLFPFNPLSAQASYEEAFAIFNTTGEKMGAILAGTGVIHTIAYQFDNFMHLENWYDTLDRLASEIGVFNDSSVEAAVISGMIVASTMQGTNKINADNWRRRALNIPEMPETIMAKIHAVRLVFWDRLIRKSAYEAAVLFQQLKRLCTLSEAHPYALIACLAANVQYYLFAGYNEALMTAINDGLKAAEDTGIHMEDMWFKLHAVMSLIDNRNYSEAQQRIDELAISAETWPNWSKFAFYSQVARLNLINGNSRQAVTYGEQSLEFASKSGNCISIASAHLLLSEVFHMTGNLRAMERHFEQGKLLLLQNDIRFFIPQVWMQEAKIALKRGQEKIMLSTLKESLQAAREGGYAFATCDIPEETMKMLMIALEYDIEVEYVCEIIRRRKFIAEIPPLHLEAWPWPVKIYTLGRFAIVCNDIPVTFSRKAQQKPLSLLKSLIAMGGNSIKQEALEEILWPDAEGDLAHQAFDTTLHRLRKLLGCPKAIKLRNGRLSLDNRYCWIDARAFEELLHKAEDLQKRENHEHASRLVDKARALYRGDFLADDDNKPWQLHLTKHYRNIFIRHSPKN